MLHSSGRLRATQSAPVNGKPYISSTNASGLTINDYCKQKGFSRNAYYYWLRRVRSKVLADSGFVEVPKPEIVQEHPSVSGQTITIKTGHLQISLPLSIPKDTLAMVIEVTAHAE